MKIAPGVRLNVGKKSMSVRVGGRGLGLTVGTAGARVSAGIPGTGLYMTQRLSSASRSPKPTTDVAPRLVPLTREPGTGAPTGWIVTTAVFALAALGGDFMAIPLAAGAGWVTWRRLNAPRYVALKKIRHAISLAKANSDEADAMVREAAAEAQDSWTVQLEAAAYFASRDDAATALQYFINALDLLPGDRRRVHLAACDAAMAAGRYTWVIETLEPHVASMRPEESDLDAALLATFALAQLGVDQAGIALEVTKRLPLRRRNLSASLLYGLCVRALAKHASGQKASAKRDLERVYAIDPGFPFLKTAQELIGRENAE